MSEEAREALSLTNFDTIDLVIVVIYLLISLGIGVMVKRYAGSMVNYIGAGRRVGTWLGVATMTGTELGLVTVMYSAQKGYTGGFASFHMAVIAGVVTLFVGLTGFIVGPLRRLRVLTIPEFYEKRFNKKVRVFGAILLVLAGVLNMGLFLKIGSQFIVGVTGLASEGEALKWVMIGLLVLVLLYTTMGGMISVILTDYVQFVVLSFGLLLATGLAIQHLGWDPIFEAVHTQLGPGGFDPTVADAGFGPSYIFWQIILAGFVGSAVWPTAVARALAMRSEKAVRRQYCWSSVSFTVRFLLPYFWGICALVFITSHPGGEDLRGLFFPPEGSEAEPLDNLLAMPVFVGRLVPSILLGVLVAGMIAAFMSTHDSYFLTWSSVITQDIVAPLKRKPFSTRSRVNLTRILIVLMGGYVLYWGIFYKGSQDIWEYMGVTGGIYFTGAFVVLIFGIYWKRTSSTGALLGLCSGLLMLFGLDPLQRAVGLKFEVKGETVQVLTEAQIGLITVGVALVLTVLGSLLKPDPPKPEPAEAS